MNELILNNMGVINFTLYMLVAVSMIRSSLSGSFRQFLFAILFSIWIIIFNLIEIKFKLHMVISCEILHNCEVILR